MVKKIVRYEIVEKYLELNFPKKETRYQYRSHLNKFFMFLDADPNTYFDEEKKIVSYEEDVKKYWNYMIEKLNAKSIPPQLSTIRNFLEEHEIEFKSKTWKNLARRGKGNGTVREDRLPTITELQKILSYGDERDKAYFMMMATSGMREGELCKIRIVDIDFNSNPTMIKIPAPIAKNKKKRYSFMTKEATQAVQYWLETRQKYIDTNARKFTGLKKYLENKYSREFNGTAQDRVFPWTPKTARWMWNRLLEKANLTEKDQATGDYVLHLYVLRKFFETKLSEMVPDKFVKAMMGHSGYMGDPYFKPFGDIPKLKEMYQKGMTKLLIYQLPENQEDIDDIQKQLAVLQSQVKELLRGSKFAQQRTEDVFIAKTPDGTKETVRTKIDVSDEELLKQYKEEQKDIAEMKEKGGTAWSETTLLKKHKGKKVPPSQ